MVIQWSQLNVHIVQNLMYRLYRRTIPSENGYEYSKIHNSGRLRFVRTQQMIGEVGVSVHENPSQLVRKRSQEPHINKPSLHKIL